MSSENTLDSVSSSGISLLSDYVRKSNLNYTDYIPRNTIKPIPKGAKIEWFKPVANGLYTELIKNYNNVSQVVHQLINDIDSNFSNINNLLQIIPDLLLLQYEIKDYSSQQYETQMKTYFEDIANTQNIEHREIIFSSDTPYAKALSNLIDLLLWHLCKQLTVNPNNLLLTKKIFRVLCSFIRHLGASEIDAFRLTAYTFAFRINKFLCLRIIQLATEDSIVNAERSIALYSAIIDIIKKNEIDSIYKGRHNSFYSLFYIDFAKHYSICATASFELFVNRKNLSFLASLLKLKNVIVVQEVLKSCSNLLNQDEIKEMFESEEFQAIVEDIYGKLNHKNGEISLYAAQFFAQIPTRFDLADRMINRLIIKAYSINLVYAQQCGKVIGILLQKFGDLFYQVFIRCANKIYEDSLRLSAPVKYSYLVEALYNHVDYLQPLAIILALTRPSELTSSEYKTIVEILYHSCCIAINGKLSIERNRIPDRKHVSKNTSVAQLLLREYSSLIVNPHFDDTSLIWFLKALTLINYKGDVHQFKQQLTDVITKVLKYFESNDINRYELWNAITLFILKASVINGGEAYLIQLENILNRCIIKYLNVMDPFNKGNIEEEDLRLELKLQIVCELLKMKTILGKGIMPENMNLDLFYTYLNEESIPIEILKEEISCSSLFVENKIKQLLKNTREITPDDIKLFKIEIMSLWYSFNTLFAEYPNLRHTIFEAMVITIANYKKLFTPDNLSKAPDFKSAYFNYWETCRDITEIFTFFYQICFHDSLENAEFPLNSRRTYVDLFFSMFYEAGKVNYDCNNYVFITLGHYHKYYKHFSRCYQRFLQSLANYSEEELYWVICNTLHYIKQQSEDYMEINLDELAESFAEYLSEQQKFYFIHYLVDHAEEFSDIIVHLQIFTAPLKKTYRDRAAKYIKNNAAHYLNI